MKKVILLNAVILLSATTFVQAQDGELSGTVDITYLTQYIWRGYEMYGSQSAIQPTLNLDLYGTGLGMKVLWSRANSSGYELEEELDLTLSYSNKLYEYETYATNYKVGWMYYYFPDGPGPGETVSDDWQEMFATLSWPEMCPEGVVPSYTVIKMWASETGSPSSGISGWLHILGLGYDLPIEGLLPDTPEQILHLSVATVYNDGVGGVDHDWSHAVFGVSTGFDLGSDLTLIPGVYYQSSWEDDVNPSDELWASVGVSYAF
ncbi:MAG TPA: TorF family putative porin [Sedimentisphaerales bacterium]|nr:TorF family putative porin [Sedimentisphaerales bacterium]